MATTGDHLKMLPKKFLSLEVKHTSAMPNAVQTSVLLSPGDR